MNTLTLPEVLGESDWAGMLTPTDRRGLSPFYWDRRSSGEISNTYAGPGGLAMGRLSARLTIVPVTSISAVESPMPWLPRPRRIGWVQVMRCDPLSESVVPVNRRAGPERAGIAVPF